jgi:beta-lactamase class A
MIDTRRSVLLGAAALLGAGGALAQTTAAAAPVSNWADRRRAAREGFAAIEQRLGGRVGVYAINLATQQTLGRRERERFAMCSTFKWLLAAGVLKEVEDGGLEMDRVVRFGEEAILPVSPKTTLRLAEGAKGVVGEMTVAELCEATMTVSDNAAANLLLPLVGGPAGLTDILRRSGDTVTRLDRMEPELNENAEGDVRDTTTPHAMANTLLRIAVGDFLTAGSMETLTGWMIAASTGMDRLRAGLPADWRVGDKTGTGARGAHNDVAIAWTPQGAPIAIASYITGGAASNDEKAAAHAGAARLIADAWS